MKHGPAIAKVAFMLAASASLLTTATSVSAQGLRDLIGDRGESRGDLRDLILDRLASREDLRDLLRDRLEKRSDLRDLDFGPCGEPRGFARSSEGPPGEAQRPARPHSGPLGEPRGFARSPEGPIGKAERSPNLDFGPCGRAARICAIS